MLLPKLDKTHEIFIGDNNNESIFKLSSSML